MSNHEKDGHGLDKRSRLEQKRSDDDNDEKEPDDILEPPFPFKLIPFPESFDN